MKIATFFNPTPMAEIFFEIVLWFLVALLFCRFLFRIVEYAYVLIFTRPIFVHWYFNLKKLSPFQLDVLTGHSHYFRKLSSKNQKYFQHRIVRFLENYKFIGRENEIIDDEVLKIQIASAYVMLSFGMRKYITNAFSKILIQADSYFSSENEQLHNGEFNPKYKAVVFSRKALQESFGNGSDNLNLAIHEFAHVITFHALKGKDVSSTIFSDQYQKIIKKIKQFDTAEKLKNSTYFRIYAFTNQYEFIAVILEHYFESPDLFAKEFPELYKDVRLMINQ